MANDIRQKIVLDGEKEYNSALAEARRNLKTLRSELKAETAELGANATAQQKNETKAKSLQKQIKEQEKVVATLRSALDEVKEKYGDNDEAVAKWEQKLNDARATLGNMRNELSRTGKEFDTVKKGSTDAALENYALAESFGKISQAAESMSGAVEKVFSGVLNTIRTAIGSVWGELMDIAGKADNYLDLASYLGATGVEVQKWDRALTATGNSMSTITSMIARLKYGGKADKVTEWFGISGENYTNDLAYLEAVIQKMYDMKDEMVGNGTWAEAMGAIFGQKKVQDVDSILSDWDAIRRGLGMFDAENGGVGLTDDELQTMADLNVEVGLLQERWNAFKDSVATKMFGHLALDLTGQGQVILEDLMKYLDTGSDEDLSKLEADITAFFDRVVAAIESAAEKLGEAGAQLEESDNGIVKAIGAAMSGLSAALEWIANPDNIDLVIKGFEALAAFWVAGKGLSLVNTIAQLAANFNIIKGAGAISGLSAGGGAAGGLGSFLSTAGYLAVGIMMVAPTVAKLFDPKTWNKSEMDKTLDKVSESTPKEVVQEGLKEAGISNRDLLKTGAGRLGYMLGLTNDPSVMALPKGNKPAEEPASTQVASGGVTIPRAGAKKLLVTEEQMTAAEQFWDNWRIYNAYGGVNEGSFNKSWDAFEQAFEGNEDIFNRLNDMMERLMTEIDANGESPMGDQWKDLPAEWWPKQGQQGLTSDDLTGFRTLPAGIRSAVRQGISGIQVTLDGATVGRLVTPYVSQAIAFDVI